MTAKKSSAGPAVIGWREWVCLPELGITAIKAKVDTGARTSALHAFSTEVFTGPDSSDWVRFGMHPDQQSVDVEVVCESRIIDRRIVRDSGGHQEERFVIRTPMTMNAQQWDIEVTLTSRDDMLFRMLLGRTACRGRYVVDPGKSFILGGTKDAPAD